MGILRMVQLASPALKIASGNGQAKGGMGAVSNSTRLNSPNRQPVHNREAPAAHCESGRTQGLKHRQPDPVAGSMPA